MTEKDVSLSMSDSLDFLDVLQEEGLIVIPSDPTPEMLVAGMKATGRSEDEVRAIYVAMLNADKSERSVAIN